MGAAMGLTAVGIIYSPWGKQSGAHFNPALTITFWGLGKIETGDAISYVIFQFIGGLLGVLLTHMALGESLAVPPVSYLVTVPGAYGAGVAHQCGTARFGEDPGTLFSIRTVGRHDIENLYVALTVVFLFPTGPSIRPLR